MEFVRTDLITKTLKDRKTQICETIWSRFTISNENESVLMCLGHSLIIIFSFIF